MVRISFAPHKGIEKAEVSTVEIVDDQTNRVKKKEIITTSGHFTEHNRCIPWKPAMDDTRLPDCVEGEGSDCSHTEAHYDPTEYVGIALSAVECNHNKCNQRRNIKERNV